MKTFEELGVSPEIRRAIEEMGYEQPMPVQEEVIPYLLGENNDVVALAQTGTGKTAAFGLPLIQKLKNLDKDERKLIYLRYFSEKTQTQVGKELGISQVQVSRMEKRILRSLQESAEKK